MQLNNNISFPVNLGTWQLSNGGSYMTADYETWDSDQNQPYAGGFAMAVFSGGGGSNVWNLLWVAPYRLALQANDSGLFVWASTGMWSPIAGLTDGSQNNQQSNTSYGSQGVFSLYNLGGGAVKIKSQAGGGWDGVPMVFRWDDTSWSDWGFQIIQFTTGNESYEDIQVSGAHFPILLLTGYGTGLTLSNLDLAANGYIQSVAGSDFTGAHLEGTVFSNLPNPSLAGCNFSGAHMSGAQMAGCNAISKAIWTGVDLSNTYLGAWNFSSTPGTDLSGATLIGATITNGNPRQSHINLDFTGGKFVGAHLDNARAEGVTFDGVDFTNATLTGAHLDGASFRGAVLVGANFAGATLAGTDFTGANLTGAHFDNCDVSNTIFDASPLFGRSTTTRTTFINATNLPATKLGLNWSYLDLTGANITNVPQDLTGLQAQNTLFPDHVDLTGIILVNANFTGAQMFYATLSKANLQNAILDGALLKGAHLVATNLTSASMKGTWLIAEEGIKDPTKYEAADVSGAFLVNTVMDGAFANGVNFTGALLVSDPMVSTTQASASQATMNRVNFGSAVIINAMIRNTQLAGANFDSATLIGSAFPQCQIVPTSDGTDSVPSMETADIRGTLFADVAANGNTTNLANMDGLDMRNAIYSVSNGQFQQVYPGYQGKVVISTSYGPTVLGSTFASTVCPNGSNGPCTLAVAERAAGD